MTIKEKGKVLSLKFTDVLDRNIGFSFIFRKKKIFVNLSYSGNTSALKFKIDGYYAPPRKYKNIKIYKDNSENESGVIKNLGIKVNMYRNVEKFDLLKNNFEIINKEEKGANPVDVRHAILSVVPINFSFYDEYEMVYYMGAYHERLVASDEKSPFFEKPKNIIDIGVFVNKYDKNAILIVNRFVSKYMEVIIDEMGNRLESDRKPVIDIARSCACEFY